MTTSSEATSLRVLYLESDADLARHVRATLEARDHRVHVIENTEDGLEFHRDGDFDVLAISDRPPQVDGLTAMRALAERSTVPPTVIVARHESVAVAVEAMQLGAMECLVKDADGQFAHILGPVLERAVASHRLSEASDRTEKALRESEERLTSLTDQSLIGVAVWRHDGFVYANEALAQMTGRSVSDLLRLSPRAILAIVEPEDRAGVEEMRLRSLAQGESVPRHEFRIRARSGRTRWVEQQARRITYEDAPAIMLSFIDVTERRQAEEKRLTLERQMLQAQKLESLGVLAGNIAHDFNNLLMGVLGHAGMALHDLPPASAVRESVKGIQSAANQAAALTQQMLAYAGQGQFRIRSVDLSRLVEGMSRTLRTSIPRSVSLDLDLERNLPPVAADGAQMQHVVMNLVRNSAEAIGSRRGVISLRTGARTYDESELADGSIGAIPEPGAFVFLEIRDDGPGMAPEILSRTFEPFTSPKSSGRGLGLAGALGVVHGHDGTIQVASEPNRGTRVRILLPASRREAPAPAAPESAAPILAPDQGSILVVDDDRLVRDLVTLMLERAGMSVLTAVDGVEALAAFEAHHTEIACVILDLTMPRMGGEETLERIRAMDATMPVLLSSGYGRPESATRLEDEAFTDFLAKPYDAADLLARIRAIMNPASDEKRAPPE